MPVYGFNDQADFNRARDAIRKIEGERMDVRPRRRLYPVGVGGDAGLQSYIVTDVEQMSTWQGDPDRDGVAYAGSVKALKVNSTLSSIPEASDEDDNIYISDATTVLVKGSYVLVSRFVGSKSVVVGGIGTRILCYVDTENIEADEIGDIKVPHEFLDSTHYSYGRAYNLTGKIVTVGQRVVVDLFQTNFIVGDGDEAEYTRFAIVAVIDCADTNQTVG